MFDSFLTYMLISAMLIISGFRIFFIRIPRYDTPAILPVLALILSVAAFFIWGATPYSIAYLPLSFYFFSYEPASNASSGRKTHHRPLRNSI
ncbi:hypothetical protein [Treponema zioleckii]|uniref:hypothetical protein n=1 Tax=Treponema zioleckii TaxID=331680 RepID=UPI00168B5C20|nr:hypothetical protein [Treponema zioleckii]